MNFLDYIWLIPLFPLCGAALMLLFGKKLDPQPASGQREDRNEVPTIEIVGDALSAQLRHRRRLRRFDPPWFCPRRSGRRDVISHTALSGSGTGIAIVSSYINREPSFRGLFRTHRATNAVYIRRAGGGIAESAARAGRMPIS